MLKLKENEKIIKNIHNWSAVVVIALTPLIDFFQSNIISTDNKLIKFIFIIFFSIILCGLYELICFFCEMFYKKIYMKKKYPEHDITGKWYHYHYIEDNNNYLRFGEVTIKQEFFRIKMKGVNYSVRSFEGNKPNPKNHKITQWHSITGELSKSGEIITSYMSQRSSGSSDIREGIHHFNILTDSIKNGKPQKITGNFTDCAPSQAHGCVVLFRSELDRDRDLHNIYIDQQNSLTKITT